MFFVASIKIKISTYLSLWSILRSVHSSVVKTSIWSGNLAILAIGVIEVWHSPAIFFVLVVMGVGGAVVWGGDALGVGCGGAVVEVDLTASHVSDTGGKLLRWPGTITRATDTNHPNKQDQNNDEQNSSSDTSGNVGKLGLLSALNTSKTSSTLTVRLSLWIHQTFSSISTESITDTEARVFSQTSSIISPLTLTVEVIGRLKQTNRVFVTKLTLALLNLTPVGALRLTGGPHLAAGVVVWCAGVGGTVDTRGLLVIRLVCAHWTSSTLVINTIQVLSCDADRKVAISQALGTWSTRGSSHWTFLTSPLNTLGPVASNRTSLTFSIDTKLVSVLTVWSAFRRGDGLLDSCCQSNSTNLTGEFALLRLVLSISTVSAKTGGNIVVLSSRTFPLAVVSRCCSNGFCDTFNILDGGALGTGSLGKIWIVEANVALGAHLRSLGLIKVCSRGTSNTLLIYNHLAFLALKHGVVEEAWGVKKGARDGVIDGL